MSKTEAMKAWERESGMTLPPTRAELQAEIARLREALEAIRDTAPWVGTNPEYGDGHDAAREAAADIAREALANPR